MANKKLEVPTAALEAASEKAGKAAKKRTEEIKKEISKGGRKPAAAYIKLDLQPKGGEDLKSYVMKRASQVSMEQGKRITATAYIQQIIEADMKKNTGKRNKRQEIAELLNNVDDKDLNAIETVVKGLCK